ncbi:MAG: hypothetical protein ACR2N5_04150, partial [Solirubrobacterales bacterium]
LFPVRWEWGRLGAVTGVAAALLVGGELLLPTSGAIGLLGRAALWLASPLCLWALRVPAAAERAGLVRMLRPREFIAGLQERIAESEAAVAAQASEQAPDRGFAMEVYEVEDIDEDRGRA